MKKLGFILASISLFLVGCTSASKETSESSATAVKSSIRQTSSAEKQVHRNQLLLNRIHLQPPANFQSLTLLLYLVVQLTRVFLLLQQTHPSHSLLSQ